MSLITGSVGHRGDNREDDVRVVQRLLNRHVLPPLRALTVDGKVGPATITTIREFQTRVVELPAPDGRVDPGGKTLRYLNRGPQTGPAAAPFRSGAPLTGKEWWRANQARYTNSRRLEDLDGAFRDRCIVFIGSLRNAGASVSISSTRRHPIRAFLMHYSWRVSRGSIRASDVPGTEGLNLEWDHGDAQASVKGAREMADLFGLVHIASLTSNHIRGLAIDMTISWNGPLVIQPKGAGSPTTILMGPRSGANVELQRVGASYGVNKLRSDPPHWSLDGR